jgi:hypothetical protein
MSSSESNWDKLIISNKSSNYVKDKINQLNSIDNFNGKYIGVLPIYWNTLDIYHKNKEKEKEINLRLDIDIDNDDDDDMDDNKLVNNINNLSISEDKIQTITTSKDYLIVDREFYYKKDNGNNYFPIYKFPNELTFSLREIKNKIKEWLLTEDFNNLELDQFEIYRIYKMTGFHLFVVLLNNKQEQIFTQSKIKNLNINSNWFVNCGIELLNLVDKEIINPFMKISQYKYNLRSIFPYDFDNNNDVWKLLLNGLLNNKEIIPYQIKWEEVIATFCNLIDSDASQNLHLYFIANVIKNDKNDKNDINYNISPKMKKQKMNNIYDE